MAEWREEDEVSSNCKTETISPGILETPEPSCHPSVVVVPSSTECHVLASLPLIEEPSVLPDTEKTDKTEFKTESDKPTTYVEVSIQSSSISQNAHRPQKRARPGTYDDYKPTVPVGKFEDDLTKVVRSAINITIRDIRSDWQRRHLDPGITQRKGLCRSMSQLIIEAIFQSLGCSTGRDISTLKEPRVISHIADVIESLATSDHVESSTFQPEQKPISSPVDDDEELASKSLTLRKLVQERRRMKTILSFGSPDFYARIVPPDIIRRLDDPKRCIADSKKRDKKIHDKRCKVKRGKFNGKAAQCLLEELATLPRPCEFSRVADMLVDIINLTVCEGHHRAKAIFGVHKMCYHFYSPVDASNKAMRDTEVAQFQQWVAELIRPLTKDNTHAPRESSIVSHRTVKETLKAEPRQTTTDSPLGSAVVHGSFLFEQPGSFKDANFRVETFRMAGTLTHKHLKPYESRSEGQQSPPVEGLVKAIVESRLSDDDLGKQGIIYVFWHEGDFGYVKIGYTEKTTVERLDQWRAQCGYRLAEHRDLDFKREIDHPRRVEHLVHAELGAKRFVEPECGGCGRTHKEWFNLGAHQAQAIVKKWTLWMRDSEPYDEDGNFKVGTKLPEVNEQNFPPSSTPAGRRKSSARSGRSHRAKRR